MTTATTPLKDGPHIVRIAAISAHLAKLLDANLIAVEPPGPTPLLPLGQPRCGAFAGELDGCGFSHWLGALAGSPREPALRKARVCYDRLAGELGVLAFDGLQGRGAFNDLPQRELGLTEVGQTWFKALDVDAVALSAQRRCFCRPCLDWGEHCHHLAGALGAGLLDRFYERDWARRAKDSRVVHFTEPGEYAFRQLFQ